MLDSRIVSHRLNTVESWTWTWLLNAICLLYCTNFLNMSINCFLYASWYTIFLFLFLHFGNLVFERTKCCSYHGTSFRGMAWGLCISWYSPNGLLFDFDPFIKILLQLYGHGCIVCCLGYVCVTRKFYDREENCFDFLDSQLFRCLVQYIFLA